MRSLLFRAWYRYLRQAGLAYGLDTVVDALQRAPQWRAGSSIGSMRCTIRLARRPARRCRRRRRRSTQGLAKSRRSTTTACCGSAGDRRGDAAHQRLRARRARRRSPSSSTAPRCPACPRPVPWREILVYSRRVEGIHLRAGPDRARRAALVRPARRFPHRDARADEGAARQERGDRADRRQGRLLSQAAARPSPIATPGSPKARRATASSSARCCRSPTTSSRARWCTPRGSSSATATIPISSSPPTRAPQASPTSPMRSPMERGFWLGDAFASRRQPWL